MLHAHINVLRLLLTVTRASPLVCMSTVVDAEGNYFVVGGGVRGGQVLGEYPSRVHVEHNPLGISNGRVIPTTP